MKLRLHRGVHMAWHKFWGKKILTKRKGKPRTKKWSEIFLFWFLRSFCQTLSPYVCVCVCGIKPQLNMRRSVGEYLCEPVALVVFYEVSWRLIPRPQTAFEVPPQKGKIYHIYICDTYVVCITHTCAARSPCTPYMPYMPYSSSLFNLVNGSPSTELNVSSFHIIYFSLPFFSFAALCYFLCLFGF